MTTLFSLTEAEKKLLPAPDFSNYDGGRAFIFQNKTYYRCGQALGCGVFGKVFRFETENHEALAVKSELKNNNKYACGFEFQKEATWYQLVYGLGELSGDPADSYLPHYILMPYFEGKTLHDFHYASLKDVFFCWIKTADAINRLHEQHRAVHGDLKSNNVIFGKQRAFVIDFGFTTRINMLRDAYLSDSPENRLHYRQYAPELFTPCRQRKSAEITQDIYSLGTLLFDMYGLFLVQIKSSEESPDTLETLCDVKNHLTEKNPKNRWPISKAIFMLASTFFSQISRYTWMAVADETALHKLNHSDLLEGIWKYTSSTAILFRRNELEFEQKMLENSGKKSKRKTQKISGLRLLQSEIRIKNPEKLGAIISDAIIKFPDLTAGVFSRRTKLLLKELESAAPVFH